MLLIADYLYVCSLNLSVSHLVLRSCISYLSVVLVKHCLAKSNLGRIYFSYGSREIESILVGKAWRGDRSKKLADPISFHTQEVEGGSRK